MYGYKLLSALTLDGPGCLLAGIYWMLKRRCYGGKNRPSHYLTIWSRADNWESKSFDRPWPTNLETPFDQLDCFSLRRSCSTYTVISRPQSGISPLTNCASMVRSGVRFLRATRSCEICPPRRGSPFWIAQAIIASSLSHRSKDRLTSLSPPSFSTLPKYLSVEHVQAV
jgi:hypothetical protein